MSKWDLLALYSESDQMSIPLNKLPWSNHSVKLRPNQPREDTFCHEVWTWGKGHRGQHGHGDMLDRLQPSAISELIGLGVTKVACGKHHTIALTLTGMLFFFFRFGKGALNLIFL